ncbi:phospholipase, partial [Campylobacter sp. US18a]
KIALFLSLCVFIWASDLQQALEYEKQGDCKKAMEIYKKLALKNSSVLIPQEQNKTKQTTQNEKSIIAAKEERQDFARLALANYLEKDEYFNPLGISAYKMNYFLPLAYSFNSLEENHNKSEAKFQLSIKKRLFENLLGLDEKYYIAYTQTSWWQIYEHSSP